MSAFCAVVLRSVLVCWIFTGSHLGAQSKVTARVRPTRVLFVQVFTNERQLPCEANYAGVNGLRGRATHTSHSSGFCWYAVRQRRLTCLIHIGSMDARGSKVMQHTSGVASPGSPPCVSWFRRDQMSANSLFERKDFFPEVFGAANLKVRTNSETNVSVVPG